MSPGAGALRRDPKQALFAKVQAGEATEDERTRFQELHEAQSRQVLEMAPDELFSVEDVDGPPPPKARIHATVICDECGEGAMETRVKVLGERQHVRWHDGQPVTADDVGHDVARAYAVTIHKAQGLTVDRAILLVDEATTAEGLYVG